MIGEVMRTGDQEDDRSGLEVKRIICQDLISGRKKDPSAHSRYY